MSDFKDLKVWQKAHKFELKIHETVESFRKSDHRPLRRQLITASESVAANIVESREQRSRKEEIRFLWISVNSANEVEHHLINARDLKAINVSDWEKLTDQLIEIRKMLRGLIRYLSGDE